MSSFFDEASLVFIPSGYKTSKAYSVKPTDGTGDLTFTRSNDTATRVGPDGLIEKVRTNVMLQSNTFNTTWAPTRLSVTSGQSDPNGGTTAWKISNNTTTNSFSFISQSATGRTFSIYAKAGELTQMLMYVGGNRGVYFDLTNGSFVGWYSVSTGINYSSTSVGGGWYRYVVTLTTTDILVAEVYTAAAGSIVYNLVSGEGLYLWRSQMELGDIATDYIATTTAAVSVGPVANVPRLDYLNSSCGKLLLEPQRTNLVTYSDGLQVAQAFGATLTKNQITSPDGYVNASLLTPLGGAAGITLATASLSGNYTISGYLKGTVAGQKVQVFGDLQGVIATFTLTTSWARYTATFNSTNATGQSIYFLSGSYFTPSENNPFYVYGAQLEAGAYATSYIPTLGAAVTRGADAALKTSISSLIGQDEGTIFVEFEYNYSDSTTQVLFKANQTTDANSVGIEVQGTTIKGLVNSAGGNIATITGTIATGTIKAALAYKTNDMAFYVNGTQVGVDTSGSIAFAGVVDILTIGQFLLNGGTFFPASRPFNQALVFKTRLSNSDLAALTA